VQLFCAADQFKHSDRAVILETQADHRRSGSRFRHRCSGKKSQILLPNTCSDSLASGEENRRGKCFQIHWGRDRGSTRADISAKNGATLHQRRVGQVGSVCFDVTAMSIECGAAVPDSKGAPLGNSLRDSSLQKTPEYFSILPARGTQTAQLCGGTGLGFYRSSCSIDAFKGRLWLGVSAPV
jgi:hypothetical protein